MEKNITKQKKENEKRIYFINKKRGINNVKQKKNNKNIYIEKPIYKKKWVTKNASPNTRLGLTTKMKFLK